MSMQVYILSILWTLVSVSAKGYVPRVTKSLIETHQNHDYPYFPAFSRFNDSDTLVLALGNRLRISFDDGENWKTVDEIGQAVIHTYVDLFHGERGLVVARSEKIRKMIHVTEDQGRSWRKLAIPREVEENGIYTIATHPFDSNLLLLDCVIVNDEHEYLGSIVYASNDAGKSFKHMIGTFDFPMPAHCSFAASSKESTLENDGIYCVHTIDKTTNPGAMNLVEMFFQQEHQTIDTLFYTTDLGRTKRVFDELKGFSVERMYILSHNIAVITSEGNYLKDKKLWISKGASFSPAHLPDKVNREYILDVQSLPGDDQGRLLVRAVASAEDNEKYRPMRRYLMSDSSGINFSFSHPIPALATGCRTWIWCSVEPSYSLKGTLWGTFDFYKDTEEKVNLFQEVLSILKNIFSKGSHRKILPKVSMTKGSFDNGKTWTNLKVVDPSGKHKHLFKCDIDDVEHCSFQIRYGFDFTFTQHSMGGIIMKSGNAGESYDRMRRNNDMTFISRNGGVSWEVAFEFPVKTAFLDFGNIMVAVHRKDTGVYKEFFFSLDQGRTWGECHFDKPIHATGVQLRVHDLKAYMGFSSLNEESIEYIFYTIDFSNAFDGNAYTEDDLETWYLSNGKCIDGMRYSYSRRKPDAKCLMRKTFGKLELHEERCEP